MKAWGRVGPARYRSLPLHAHALLADVPLHDVWEVRLPGGAPGLTLSALRPLLTLEDVARTRPLVRWLFALRGRLGPIFRLDEAPEGATSRSPTLARVPPEILARSHVPPGTRDGPFVLLYALDGESLSEIRNATVHAFSVLALERAPGGYRGLWAIHVAPVGAITRLYMASIDPFRRWLVYPAILRHVHRRWAEVHATDERGDPRPPPPA